MKTDRNQPTRLYRTAKTHKFENLIENLDYCSTPKISTSLKTLQCLGTMRQKLYHIIWDLHVAIIIPSIMHKNFQAYSLQSHHDVESKSTNIIVKQKINYITEQIYIQKS